MSIRAVVAVVLAQLVLVPSAAMARSPGPRPSPLRVLVLDHGHVRVRVDQVDAFTGAQASPAPLQATRAAARAGARAARARGSTAAATPGPSVPGVLAGLRDSGAISAQDYQQRIDTYQSARDALGRLSGTRHTELAAVLANVDDIAARGALTAPLLPALFETLQRNRQWWATGPLLSNGQRVGFPDSQLVWEYYPGQGIEIQWLGSFGKANAAYFANRRTDLRNLLDEAVALAVPRAGGVAWDYLFRFDGGVPPWTSALSQGTGIQALARAANKLSEPSYQQVAQRALGIFHAAPPEGVRVDTPAGAHYLIYSFAPNERVLNGFIQSLIGLHDYGALANDDDARALFVAGNTEAHLEVPQYDTGAWSLYDQKGESDVSYHTLLRDFLSNLCQRINAADPIQAALAGPGPPLPGGSDLYCATARRFTGYLTTKPVIAVPAQRARTGRTLRLRFTLSKISNVSLTIVRGGRTVFHANLLAGHGNRSVQWKVPRATGRYTVRVRAVDLTGNSAQTAANLDVSGAKRAHQKAHRPQNGRRPQRGRRSPKGSGRGSAGH